MRFGIAAVVGATASASAAAVLGRRLSGPTLASLLVSAAVLAAIGVALLRSGDRPGLFDYRHAYPLLVVVVALLVGGSIARDLAVPDTYGESGAFRGAAAREARRLPVRHQGAETCARCHAAQVRSVGRDAHRGLSCESCHGAGARHVADPVRHKPRVARPANQLCLHCHQRLAARPVWFPQITPAQHRRKMGVIGANASCTVCHQPHAPLALAGDLQVARWHPRPQRCRDCHRDAPDPLRELPTGHVAVFDCGFCHREVARSHAVQKHGGVTCSSCHKFFQHGAARGRIVRSGGPDYCLLCHGQRAIRTAAKPPRIAWSVHREKVGAAVDARCEQCHQAQIHAVPARAVAATTPDPGAALAPAAVPAGPDAGVAGGRPPPTPRLRAPGPRRPISHRAPRYQNCRMCHRVGGGLVSLKTSHVGATSCAGCHGLGAPRVADAKASAAGAMTAVGAAGTAMSAPPPRRRIIRGFAQPASHAARLYRRCRICHRVGGGRRPLPETHIDRVSCRSCHASPRGAVGPLAPSPPAPTPPTSPQPASPRKDK